MTNKLDRGLERFLRRCAAVTSLSCDAREELAFLCSDVRHVDARRDVFCEHGEANAALVVIDGWAGSYNVLANGSRQFSALHIPGDLAYSVASVSALPVGVTALVPCSLALIPHARLKESASRFPEIEHAVLAFNAERAETLRGWVANLGRREGHERIAHLLCEMHLRMSAVGLVQRFGAAGAELEFPLTQEELADTAGMTPVHVNRIIQRLRNDRMIDMANRRLTIHDVPALRHLAEFDASYLHVSGTLAPCEERATFGWGHSRPLLAAENGGTPRPWAALPE